MNRFKRNRRVRLVEVMNKGWMSKIICHTHHDVLSNGHIEEKDYQTRKTKLR